MNFDLHSNLIGKHAFMSASNYHWLNYTPEKLEQVYFANQAKEYGTKCHEYAKMAIELGIKQSRSQQTLQMYINDAINYHMTPEVILFYSNNCFGTADAISYTRGKLRIHDLKTGSTPARMEQLLIYAALFCLEYREKPDKMSEIELRIYQNNQIIFYNPSPDEIEFVMNKIVDFDRRIQSFKTGA